MSCKTVTLILTILFIAASLSSVSHVTAKRGCASFGHSCFGGHGKRSQLEELVPDNPEAQSENIVFFPRGQYSESGPIEEETPAVNINRDIKFLMRHLLKSLEDENKQKNYSY